MNEQEFLRTYDETKYDRPSVTADVAIFAVRSSEPDSYRRDPERRLSILLIRRGGHPFLGCWALPGGFLKRGETISECALREVEEETGVRPSALMAVSLFTAPGRDPRGWIISQLYASVLPDGTCAARGGDDAEEARWFSVSLSPEHDGGQTLTLESGDTLLQASLRSLGARFGQTDYRVLSSGGLAFDHAAMIASALTALRGGAGSFDLIFDFLPPRFTLAEAQRVHETLTGQSVQSANFRRKIAGHVTQTDELTEGAGHRPAKLYERNRGQSVRADHAEKENAL